MKTYRHVKANITAAASTPILSTKPLFGFAKNSEPKNNKTSRLFPSKPKKIAAAMAGLAMLTSSAASAASAISIDFHGNFQAITLNPTDIAGVVPTDTWNAALGNVGGWMPVDANTLPSAADVRWNAPSSNITFPNTLGTPDHQMMEGYLEGGTIRVDLDNIDMAGLGWSSYDLYVYSDTATSSMQNNIWLGGGGPGYIHNEPLFNQYTGVTVPYTDSQVNPTGNYVKFSGLSSTNLRIRAAIGSHAVAINGIQLVQCVPEPSTALMSILGVGCLVLRRRR